MGKENLNHVEPIFDALMSSKIEFSVLKISPVEIPQKYHHLRSYKKIGSVDLRVCEADCEVSSLVQQRNFLHFGQLALGTCKYQ